MRNAQKLGQLSTAQILHADRQIVSDEMNDVEREHQQTGESVSSIILARGLCTEFDLAKAIVKQLAIPYVSAKDYEILEEVKTILPPELLHAHKIIPLDQFGDVLLLATWGELPKELVPEILARYSLKVSLVISQKSEIESVLDDQFPKVMIGEEVATRLDQLFGG